MEGEGEKGSEEEEEAGEEGADVSMGSGRLSGGEPRGTDPLEYAELGEGDGRSLGDGMLLDELRPEQERRGWGWGVRDEEAQKEILLQHSRVELCKRHSKLDECEFECSAYASHLHTYTTQTNLSHIEMCFVVLWSLSTLGDSIPKTLRGEGERRSSLSHVSHLLWPLHMLL